MIENSVIVYNGDLETVNCDFFQKMGACRHGNKCSKIHEKPLTSRTIVLKHFYLNPKFFYDLTTSSFFSSKNFTKDEVQEHFDKIFEDIFLECEQEYGRVTDMVICENLTEQLRGNVYIKFNNENDAGKAVKSLNNRWFGGRPVYAELSPVKHFNNAYCRSVDSANCPKENFCNFWHVGIISKRLFNKLRYRRTYYPFFLKFHNLKPQPLTNNVKERRLQILMKNNGPQSAQSSMRDRSRSKSRLDRSTTISKSRSSRRDRSRTRSKSRSSRRGRSRTRSKSISSRRDRSRTRSKSRSSRRDRSRTRSKSRSSRRDRRSPSSSYSSSSRSSSKS